MVPEPGKVYVVVPQWQERTPRGQRIEEAYECYGNEACMTGYWRFGALLPHPGDEGRGITFTVHEDNIIREVV